MLWFAVFAVSVLLLVLAERGMGAQVSFGGKEKPERVVGADVVLFEFDGLGTSPPIRIEGIIQEFIGDGKYKLVFAVPQNIAGRIESSATVGAPVERGVRPHGRGDCVE